MIALKGSLLPADEMGMDSIDQGGIVEIKRPRNGFGMPCCALCAEHNVDGCPGGRSPYCLTDWFAALDYQGRTIQEAIETLASATEPRLPGGVGNLDSRLATAAQEAIQAVERMRAVADEANSEARGRRVVPDDRDGDV